MCRAADSRGSPRAGTRRPRWSVVAESESVQRDADHRRRIERTPFSARQAATWAWWCCTSTSARPARARSRATWSKDIPDGGRRASAWPVIEQHPVKREVLAIIVKGSGVLEIAVMLGQDRLAVLDQAKRLLQLAAHGQHSGAVSKPAAARSAPGHSRAPARISRGCPARTAPPSRRSGWRCRGRGSEQGGDAASRSRAASSSITCGSSDKLPLVITTGRSSAAACRWCSGVVGSMKPSVESPERRLPAAAPARRRARARSAPAGS